MSNSCKCCGKDAIIKCTICQKTKYCGDECMQNDSAKHQGDCNTYNVSKDTWLALPYMYEDFMSAKQLKNCSPDVLDEVYGQKYLLKTYNSNQTVTERKQIGLDVDANLKRVPHVGPYSKYPKTGTEDYKDIMNIGDKIKITINGKDYYGKIPDNMIFGKNNGMRQKDKSKLVFWFGQELLEDSFRFNKLGGVLNINLQTYLNTDDTPIVDETILLEYAELKQKQNYKHREMRSFFGNFASIVKSKGFDPNHTAALYAQDDNRTQVRLIYDIDDSSKNFGLLKDIEISIKKNRVALDKNRINRISDFICDARDIDHVTGLVMALETHIAQLKLERNDLVGQDKRQADQTISAMQQTLNTITDHQLALETHLNENDGDLDDFDIDTNINAEFTYATNALWDHIGIRMKAAMDKDYYNMIVKEGYILEDLRNAANEMEIPEKSKLFSRGWATGARGKAKGRLGAIKKRLFEIRSETKNANTRREIQEVINSIIKKMKR